MLSSDPKLQQKLELNYTRNKALDHTARIDQLRAQFCYTDCATEYWNPESFSLLYGTPLWEQASPSQRLLLNQLYWVAYYAQIVSAEIATIFFNQTSAAGLYALEDFRLVCDMLDLETTQERSHIQAFRAIATQVEMQLWGKCHFTYPMRGPFTETMIYADTDRFKTFWKKLQLHAFGLLSADNAFLACQYFTVRGLRTLNGKLVQHKLSQYYQTHPQPESAPIPAQISHYHFLDESFHFNSSTLLSHEVVNSLKPPTAFEQGVMNLGIRGCQADHAHFSVAIKGLFWYDPALYSTIYAVLRSPQFDLSHSEAQSMMHRCFTEETEGLHQSYQIHQAAIAAYRLYLEPVNYLWRSNRELSMMMASSTIPRYLDTQRRALQRWEKRLPKFSSLN